MNSGLDRPGRFERNSGTVVHLPDLGIRGNSHFPFAEKNNGEVAGALEAWLKEKRLDAFAK